MKISFDFDYTLDQEHLRKHARYLISKHHDVYIVTSRRHLTLEEHFRGQNDDVFKMAKSLGIKNSRIIFTEYEYKWKILDELEIDVHYDDSNMELVQAIANSCKCKIISV